MSWISSRGRDRGGDAEQQGDEAEDGDQAHVTGPSSWCSETAAAAAGAMGPGLLPPAARCRAEAFGPAAAAVGTRVRLVRNSGALRVAPRASGFRSSLVLRLLACSPRDGVPMPPSRSWDAFRRQGDISIFISGDSGILAPHNRACNTTGAACDRCSGHPRPPITKHGTGCARSWLRRSLVDGKDHRHDPR